MSKEDIERLMDVCGKNSEGWDSTLSRSHLSRSINPLCCIIFTFSRFITRAEFLGEHSFSFSYPSKGWVRYKAPTIYVFVFQYKRTETNKVYPYTHKTIAKTVFKETRWQIRDTQIVSRDRSVHAIRKAMLGPGNNLRKSKKSKKEQETKLCCFFAGKTPVKKQNIL